MKIVTWAAVAVTTLFVLMNAGAAVDTDLGAPARIVGATLAVAGVAAAVGLALGRSWGRGAVVVVGALNVAAALVALLGDEEGGVVGLVVGGLGVVLGALADGGVRRAAAV